MTTLHPAALKTILVIALTVSALPAQSPATVVINNGTAGTTTNLLACLDASGNAMTCALGATGVVGVCLGTGCGMSGSATIIVAGAVSCAFDASTNAGDYVVPSSMTAGKCTDAGPAYPSAGSNLVGRVVNAHTGAGTYPMIVSPPEMRPGVPLGTSSTQYGAAFAASASAGALSFTNSGASGAVLTGAGSSAPPAFSSALNVSTVSASSYLQVTGTPPGCLHLENGSVDSEICASASTTGSWILTLPTSGGTSGYPLVTDGSGNASWAQLGNAALNVTSPLAASIDLGTSNYEVIEVPNSSATGTSVNKLAKLTGVSSTAIITATTDTSGAVGVVVAGAGTSGNAQIAQGGTASCTFDNNTTAGDYVQISSSVAGDCTDASPAYPSSGQVLGRVLSSNGSPGTYALTVWTGTLGSIGSAYAFSSGDLSGTPASATVAKVDGVSYPASPSLNTVPVVAASNAVTYEAVPNTALAHSSLTVASGTNLSGGGAVSLGGTTTLSLASPLLANVDLGTNSLALEIANQSTVGTGLNRLAKLTSSAPSAALVTATTDTSGIVGVVVAGAGTSGNAQIAQSGVASCIFDGATTAGHYVQNSSSVAGDCTDSNSFTYPPGGQVIGRVLSSNTGGGTYQISVLSSGVPGAVGAQSVTTNGVAYGATSNTVAFTASANNGVLVTSSSGVPSISTSSALTVFASNQAGSTLMSGQQGYFALSSPSGLSTTETPRRIIVPVAGTLRDLYVVTTTAQPSGTGSTLVFTVLKNGSATSLVVTVGAGAAAGKFSDTTDTVSLAAGDEISVQAKNNASATSAQIVDMSALLTP